MTSTYSLRRQDIWHRFWLYTKTHLNFYRIHVLFFTFTPLIVAGIFYGSNGATHISFVDALFLCVSHITVTGLATVDLSSLTPWQQVILLLLMCMGSPITVSWIVVYVRRYFFARKFEHIISSQISSRIPSSEAPLTSKWSRFRRKANLIWKPKSDASRAANGEKGTLNGSKVRADMIRRVEGAPRLVDPSGWVESPPMDGDAADSLSRGRQSRKTSVNVDDDQEAIEKGDTVQPSLDLLDSDSQDVLKGPHRRRSSSVGQGHHPRPHLARLLSTGTTGIDRERPMTAFPATNRERFPRTQTVEFVAPDPDQMRGRNTSGLHARRMSRGSIREPSPSTVWQARGSIRDIDAASHNASMAQDQLYSDHEWRRTLPGRTATMQSTRSSVRPPRTRVKDEDFGGFPLPHVIFARLLRRFFPRLQQHLTRTLTIPYTTTVHSQRGGQTTVLGAKPVPYISFDAIVGRNSAFHALTRENLEELGGVEYRALNILLWIVGLYFICVPLVAFVMIAPYISQPRWRDIFRPPMQHSYVSPVWYTVFQVMSAYTNTGSSLVDQSMVPFEKAYLEVLTLPFLILAGNTAFPIFLRFVIWILTKTVKRTSRANETLHFLLDHPRRCFLYLFPSHQTWFLLTILVLLNFTDCFFFLVLDIGNPDISSIPIGTRFASGFLQAIAVRAAGFSAVPLLVIAPATKVLYVVMMYISVYPIAMSVRSTNVYEEPSLGVFDDGLEDAEEVALRERSRVKVWGKYLAAHARNQLSFDMWWIALALFLVCIVERGNLQNPATATWFNIFSIIFEIVSAYGTVGLSLGTPNANYSFSGAFKPLSKLILCLVMLRGRHRGLPVAIDRAVLLPAEFKKDDNEAAATSLNEEIDDASVSLEEPTENTPKDGGPGNEKGNVILQTENVEKRKPSESPRTVPQQENS